MSTKTKFWLYSLLTAFILVNAAYAQDGSVRVVNLPNNWQEIFPGGDTLCGRGGEFSFFYHAGSSSDVVIDFVGGGACWNFESCHPESALFIDSVDYLRERVGDRGLHGIYDHDNPGNPFKDWTHVVIPYCTGDLHWGDKESTYTRGDESVTIFHKGAVNAQAVVDWTFANYQPQRIVVTGTSAGGYGSVYWLPYVKERAPEATTVHFSDGAAGVVVEEAFQQALATWNALAHVPRWIPSLNPELINWNQVSIVDLYSAIGRHYPTVMLSQFNTNLDAVQRMFYYVMGAEDPTDWTVKALHMMERISLNIPNFRYFFAAGDYHTIIPEDSLFTVTANNVKLVDWLQSLVAQESTGNIVCAECDLLGTEN